jgi:hypothetical protein
MIEYWLFTFVYAFMRGVFATGPVFEVSKEILTSLVTFVLSLWMAPDIPLLVVVGVVAVDAFLCISRGISRDRLRFTTNMHITSLFLVLVVSHMVGPPMRGLALCLAGGAVSGTMWRDVSSDRHSSISMLSSGVTSLLLFHFDLPIPAVLFVCFSWSHFVRIQKTTLSTLALMFRPSLLALLVVSSRSTVSTCAVFAVNFLSNVAINYIHRHKQRISRTMSSSNTSSMIWDLSSTYTVGSYMSMLSMAFQAWGFFVLLGFRVTFVESTGYWTYVSSCCLLSLSVVSLLKTKHSDPGAVPITEDPFSKCNLCKHCQTFKPVSCHHCSKAQRCIVRMDHACPWTGNTIGLLNHKFFLQFITSTFIFCCLSVHQCLAAALVLPKSTKIMYGTLWVSAMLGIFTFVMILEQAKAIRQNTPKIDVMQHKIGQGRPAWETLTELMGGPVGLSWVMPTRPEACHVLFQRVVTFRDQDVIPMQHFD